VSDVSAASGAASKSQAAQADGAVDRLKAEAIGLVGALGDRAMASMLGRLQNTAGRLTDYVENGAGPGLMGVVTGGRSQDRDQDSDQGEDGKATGPIRKLLGRGQGGGGQGGGKGGNLKVTNIVETIDVGAPLRLTYDLWTQFADFPSFMKKVENVEQPEEEALSWKAQVLWSHRTWESTILEQSPDDKIIWRSKGAKGYVDGAVTFHELAPNLTRILVVLEYHPQGFFEHTGNIWRAQGRRVRLELKHFRRHLMTEVLLHPDEVEGWRGVIRDGEVVPEDEDADQDEYQGDEYPEDEDSGQARDEAGDRQDAGNREEDDEDEEPDDEPGEARGERDADRQERRRPERRDRQPGRRPRPEGQERTGRRRERPDHEDRPRRVTRRAEARGGARS